MDIAIIFGQEAELIGFGLHLHRSFAGHLITALRSSYLQHKSIKHGFESEAQERQTITGFTCIIPVIDRVNTHLDHVGIECGTKHGGHQPDVFRVQISLERTKEHCSADNMYTIK